MGLYEAIETVLYKRPNVRNKVHYAFAAGQSRSPIRLPAESKVREILFGGVGWLGL